MWLPGTAAAMPAIIAARVAVDQLGHRAPAARRRRRSAPRRRASRRRWRRRRPRRSGRAGSCAGRGCRGRSRRRWRCRRWPGTAARVDPRVALERRDRAGRPDVRLGERSRSAVETPGRSSASMRSRTSADDAAGAAHPLDLGAGLAGDHRSDRPRSSTAGQQRVGDLVDGLPAVDGGQDAAARGSGRRPRGAAGTCWAIRARTVASSSSARWMSSAPSRSQMPVDRRRVRRPGCRRGRWPRRSGGRPCAGPGPRAGRRCRRRPVDRRPRLGQGVVERLGLDLVRGKPSRIAPPPASGGSSRSRKTRTIMSSGTSWPRLM